MLVCLFCAHLWPEWTRDPDLSHGPLVPLASLLLAYLARRADGGGSLSGRASATLTLLGCLGAVLCQAAAGLLAASLDWSSPVVDFALAAGIASAVLAAAAAFSGRPFARTSFGWSAVAMGLIWLLASPVPPGTYTRMTLALQLGITSSVMKTLSLLGVPAHQQGNIIELARGTVGVEEACSGVRSLISCIFAGIVFSATLVRGTWRRATIVALAVVLALAMNFVRSLALTLLVNAGVRISGFWHDSTGYAVLAVTAASLLALAVRLSGSPEQSIAPQDTPAPTGSPSPYRILFLGLAAVLVTLGLLAAATRRAPEAGSTPNLQALVPLDAPGWTVTTQSDLYQFADTLHTDNLVQRTYTRGAVAITLYVAYWPPGRASVGLVGSHTPDACWPGSGWTAQATAQTRVALPLGGTFLPEAQARYFVSGTYPQHVWFWQLYDHHTIDVGNTRSVPALLSLALRYGIRQGADQAFVRVSSNRPWPEISQAPFLQAFFKGLDPLGLEPAQTSHGK